MNPGFLRCSRHYNAEGGEEGEDAAPPAWDFERLRRYVAHVKQAFAPRLSPAAEQLIAGYYQLQRRAEGRSAARTTIRLLESLIRLAQAHAR